MRHIWRFYRFGVHGGLYLVKMGPAISFAIDHGLARRLTSRRNHLHAAAMPDKSPRDSSMQRLSMTIDDELLETIDRLVEQHNYTSRSEAIRDILRSALAHQSAPSPQASQAFGVLSYVYEHELRDLAKRLTKSQHEHHHLSVSTLHVHTSKTDCLEVAVLKGTVAELEHYADGISTQRGVRYADLHLIPATD